jgi:hypothetical protein
MHFLEKMQKQRFILVHLKSLLNKLKIKAKIFFDTKKNFFNLLVWFVNHGVIPEQKNFIGPLDT